MSSRKVKISELIQFDKNESENNKYIIIGTDEVGRGPVAGPVTACALYFEKFNKNLKETLKYLDDSKKFSSNPKLRKELSEEIKKHACFAIAECTPREIETYNILQASLIAMYKACNILIEEHKPKKEIKILIDGRFKIPDFKYAQLPVIKGDAKSASIAAASIIAKVSRDELMADMGKQYPYYEWHKNKGYPTKAHIAAIREYGHVDFHRKTFLSKITNEQLKLKT